jgi:NADPH:quinone reductase
MSFIRWIYRFIISFYSKMTRHGITSTLPKTMQALQITMEPFPPGELPGKPTLQVVTIPTPSVSSGSVLVKVHATAINPSDVLNSAGSFPHTTFPRVPGRDFAGTVVNGPRHLRGKKVFGTSGHDLSFTRDGSHAEYCAAPEDGVVIMPRNMSFVQAATIGVPFTTAWMALERAQTKPTDVVLVVGAFGAVGTAACQIARSMGCDVLTAARRDYADIDLRTDPMLKAGKTLTGGLGPDVIIDTVGDPLLMRRALEILARRGRLCYIAAPQTFSADFVYNMKDVYRMEKTITGCNSLAYTSKEMGDILRRLAPGFDKGLYRVTPDAELIKVQIGQEAIDTYRMLNGTHSKKYVILTE